MTLASWPVESWLALALFWSAGIIVALAAWARWSRQPDSGKAATQWHCLWLDGKDPARRRHCSGAKSVIGRVRYRHYDRDGRCIYVGKAVVFARRMYQESKEIMALEIHHTVVERVSFLTPLVTAEAEWIDLYQPTLNRNRGVRRLPALARIMPWRY